MQHTETKTVRVCFFGDSFTNGTGDDTCLGWVGRVCAMQRRIGHDVTMYNLGIRRDTSVDIAARWEAESQARLLWEGPHRLVFAFGNNDTAQTDDMVCPRVSLEHTLDAARHILIVASKTAPTFLIGPVPAFTDNDQQQRIIEVSQALSALCTTFEVPFLNLTNLPEAVWDDWKQEALDGDGIHPNSAGYHSLADVIGNWEQYVL